MVLYEAISIYHLLRAILLKEKETDKKSDLLIFDSRYNSLTNEQKVYLSKKFNKIICYNISYANNHSKDQIKSYFESLLGNTSKYDKIYCGCPHHSFGLFLALSKINFIFCEDGAGILSRPEIIRDINNKLDVRKIINLLYEEYGLYDATNKNINSIICNKKAQKSDYVYTGKEVDFDVVEEIKKLPEVGRKELIENFVDLSKYSFTNANVLFLTQAFITHEILSFEDTVLIYQLIIDYLFDNKKIIFKTHPDDLLYYKKLFPTSDVIKEAFPSEFLPFMFKSVPDCVATISSTGINNLKGHFKDSVEFDTSFEKDFKFIHRYYVGIKLAMQLSLSVCNISANDMLLKQLNKKFACSKNDNQSKLYFVDYTNDDEIAKSDKTLELIESLSVQDCVLFINSKQDFCWYDYNRKDIWENIVPLVIKKNIIDFSKQDTYTDVEEEIIYLYSKNKEMLKMVENYSDNKRLENTNIQIEISKLTPEQERIKVLEGMLAATEKRLAYYVEKEKEE